MTRQTLGVIFGNRDFFPDLLVSEARRDVLVSAFAKSNVWIIAGMF